MSTTLAQDDDRFRRWVAASRALDNFQREEVRFLIISMQGLGRLDCELIAEDETLLQQLRDPPTTPSQHIELSLQLQRCLTVSYLWVLGAYELVRTLDQQCDTAIGFLGATLTEKIRKVKHEIERLRMPLAKAERAKRFPGDSPIAYPVISPEFGIAWLVRKDVFISRRKISDTVLDVMEEISNHFPPTPSNCVG